MDSKTLEFGGNRLDEIGPKFGYYPERTKTQSIVKTFEAEYVHNIFFGTKFKGINEGHRYFRGTVGTSNFNNIYM